MQEGLFGDTSLPQQLGTVAEVAIERRVDSLLDYAVSKTLAGSIDVGQRVRVPLGRSNKPAFGYVVAVKRDAPVEKLKSILAIVDARSLVNEKLMRLALWVSSYYLTPLGMVLENLIPSAVKKRIGVKSIKLVRAALDRAKLQTLAEGAKAPKRRAILGRLLQLPDGEDIPLVKLALEAGVKPGAVLTLVKKGVLSASQVSNYDFDHLTQRQWEKIDQSKLPPLTAEQCVVLEALLPKLGDGFSVHLLRGVTGSGKTEVYLRAIDAVVKSGRGAVVLVPEIALTPQTMKRFTQRFDRVAVMHSGLSQSQRHQQWQQIAEGGADVVIGARSGVFAPHPNIGLIVVDEEHEQSYKQDSAPRYHARDVAIKRGQLENVPILLGSATPSLEMWAKVSAAPSSLYTLHTMASRVKNQPLPPVELIDMKEANKRRPGVHLLSPRLEQVLKWTIDQGQQAILLLNRRGYSSFIYCASCQTPIGCKYCDKTMTYHLNVGAEPPARTTSAAAHTGQIHCHCCLAVNTLPSVCPTCGKKLTLFGLGTQRVEQELKSKFPDLRFTRVDSDSIHRASDYEKLLGQFAAGEIQCLLGTQMLAKGLDFPNVTMVGVISADTALSIPDLRSGERTFQLLTQVAGRAGRGDKPGRVIVQSFQPDDPTIQLATTQDYVTFATGELAMRKSLNLPPFTRQARIVVSHLKEDALAEKIETIASLVRTTVNELRAPVTVKGPMPPVVGRQKGEFRAQVVIGSPQAAAIQAVLSVLRKQKVLVGGDRVTIDVDPVSMM
jgi:primosomal protein N' (replication factor Y) (superfamily II helicase)